jgi:hypothetical protein
MSEHSGRETLEAHGAGSDFSREMSLVCCRVHECQQPRKIGSHLCRHII